MTRRGIFLAALVLLTIVAQAAPAGVAVAASVPDILAAHGIDGGFERQGFTAPDSPWKAFVSGSASVVRDASNRGSGSYSAWLRSGSGLAELDLILPDATPGWGRACTLHFKARTDTAVGIILALKPEASSDRLQSFDPAGHWVEGLSLVRDLVTPGDWRDFSLEFVMPEVPAGPGARLVLGFVTDRGDAWIDDVAIEING